MSNEVPYPNGILYRVEDSIKRLDRLESGASGTITGDLKQDIIDIRTEIREGFREVREDAKQVKRAFWAMSGVFGLLITILLQIRPIG